jgi:hypothetical protein
MEDDVSFWLSGKTHVSSDCLTHREQGLKPLHLSFFRWQLLQAEAALLRWAERRALCKMRLNSVASFISKPLKAALLRLKERVLI